ncbi:MAG: hypothetical protein JW888_08380, partial [Pirellulales bacterium]|nr:hypothetical protein [Pirellulales bacterium]
MKPDPHGSDSDRWVEQILGYLNFSSGATDTAFLRSLNGLFGALEARSVRGAPTGRDAAVWRQLAERLRAGVRRVQGTSKAFEHLDQAEAILRLVFDEALPGYRRFHEDLLFHQTETTLFRPLFIGRVCEAVLREGKPWDETDRIVAGATARLNDFIGHRPVAVLHSDRKLQPYDHERVRPIPLWIRDVGSAVGAYRELIDKTIAILRQTDPDLLARAWFDLEVLDELAVDPRAYDFDHPVHRRPNYQFGQWDPHHINQGGFYHRFVFQQVTLDGILQRVSNRGRISRKEALFEAAAVLAGTLLMGVGISGDGPGRHDSKTTLAVLFSQIAEYRDDFYQQLLASLSGKHRERLTVEAERLHQAFGGARQHLNQFLAAQRASQLQHVHLSQLFARMGYAEAAVAQAHIVPVASARMQCEIQCRLTASHQHINNRELDEAALLVNEIEDYLHRAIECGALVDPWNILGFDAQFSLFPALENSCPDHRVDELLDQMDDIFDLYARLEKAAAAAGRKDLQQRLSGSLEKLAAWWDQFATTEVSSVEGISGREACESAARVATVLGLWHAAGTAAGDVAFWREHVDDFQSSETYFLVVDALLDQRDLIAAMGLLMQWLSQSDEIPLVEGKYSFHQLALRWMRLLWTPGKAADDPWTMTRKFMDYLEAGGEAFWTVPQLELFGQIVGTEEELEEEPADGEEGLYEAAYENVVYRDTTDDGFEGEVFEPGGTADDFELTAEAERISKRLAFLRMLARLWHLAALATVASSDENRTDVLRGWLQQAEKNRKGLLDLLDAVHRYRIAVPSGTEEAMIEYDRRQSVKEMMLERIVVTTIETSDAARVIRAVGGEELGPCEGELWERHGQRILHAGWAGKTEPIKEL